MARLKLCKETSISNSKGWNRCWSHEAGYTTNGRNNDSYHHIYIPIFYQIRMDIYRKICKRTEKNKGDQQQQKAPNSD